MEIDWNTIFSPDVPLLEIVLRGSVMYISLFILLRVILKRQTGSLGMTDLLLITLLADASQNAMAGEYTSIIDGIVLVATIIFWNYAFDWLSFKFEWFSRLIEPTPLLLVKDPARLESTPLLVCIDPMHAHDKPAALDHQLLKSAALLAGPLGGRVHALHVFSIPTPVTVIGDAYIAAAAVTPPDATVEIATGALRELAAAHALPRERARLRVGRPAREILDEANEVGAGIVMMGAVSRGRLDRWFVGSTAEAVLDRLACNVWVEKLPQD